MTRMTLVRRPRGTDLGQAAEEDAGREERRLLAAAILEQLGLVSTAERMAAITKLLQLGRGR